MSGLLRQQWITPLALAPFASMFIVHRWLGLSDAMLAAPAPGETHWPLYNLAMVLAFQAGIGIYVLHTLWLACRSPWLAAGKMVVLVGAWAGFLAMLK